MNMTMPINPINFHIKNENCEGDFTCTTPIQHIGSNRNKRLNEEYYKTIDVDNNCHRISYNKRIITLTDDQFAFVPELPLLSTPLNKKQTSGNQTNNYYQKKNSNRIIEFNNIVQMPVLPTLSVKHQHNRNDSVQKTKVTILSMENTKSLSYLPSSSSSSSAFKINIERNNHNTIDHSDLEVNQSHRSCRAA